VKRIVWTEPAKADVRRIDRETAMRILTALDRFARTGEGDVKRLQDIEPPEFRLRVGDYRLFFVNIADALEVRRVLHRREAYR
jgi:mRNA-degrading endonuclease RelE of RelBE toxin-antitoxin system